MNGSMTEQPDTPPRPPSSPALQAAEAALAAVDAASDSEDAVSELPPEEQVRRLSAAHAALAELLDAEPGESPAPGPGQR